MALFLIIAGALLIVSSVKNVQSGLWSAISQSIFGSNGKPSFWPLALAIVVLGSIGFVPKLRGVSIALLVLLMVVIFETGGKNFFANLGVTKS